MKQSRHHLAEVIGERTLHIQDDKKLAHEIAAYLLHEKQVTDLESLMRDVMQYRARKGIIEAVAVSAHPLTEAVLRDIQQLIKHEYPKAHSVIVRERRDDTVVGGLRVDMAHEQLDMSVKTKLSMFKRLTALERNKT